MARMAVTGKLVRNEVQTFKKGTKDEYTKRVLGLEVVAEDKFYVRADDEQYAGLKIGSEVTLAATIDGKGRVALV